MLLRHFKIIVLVLCASAGAIWTWWFSVLPVGYVTAKTSYFKDTIYADFSIDPLDTFITPTFTYTTYLPLVFYAPVLPEWEYLGPENVKVRTVAPDPLTPGVLYIGTMEHGIYKTFDNGLTWENKSQGLPITLPVVSFSVEYIAVDPIHTQNVYASNRQSPHIFWSNDEGENWLPGGKTDLPITGITINPFTPTTLYVSTPSFDTVPATVLRSTNAGLNWGEISPGIHYGRHSLVALKTERKILCASFSSLYQSMDDGDNWELLASVSLGNISASPYNERTLYSTERQVSYDGGESWNPMKGEGLPGYRMFEIVASSIFSQVLYTSFTPYDTTQSCAGVYISLDNGQHWNSMNVGLKDFCVGDLALAPDASYLYAATDNGLWRYDLQPSSNMNSKE